MLAVSVVCVKPAGGNISASRKTKVAIAMGREALVLFRKLFKIVLQEMKIKYCFGVIARAAWPDLNFLITHGLMVDRPERRIRILAFVLSIISACRSAASAVCVSSCCFVGKAHKHRG